MAFIKINLCTELNCIKMNIKNIRLINLLD